MKNLFFLIFLASCTSVVPKVKEIKLKKSKPAVYCLRAETTYQKKKVRFELCTESMAACQKAGRLGKKYGGFVDLDKIDECRLKSKKRLPRSKE